MATTLKDIMTDFMTEVRENEHLDYEAQKDPYLILEEYIDIVIRRIIGKGGE